MLYVFRWLQNFTPSSQTHVVLKYSPQRFLRDSSSYIRLSSLWSRYSNSIAYLHNYPYTITII